MVSFKKFWKENRLEIILVFLLTFLAGFLRFFLLGEVPCGLFPDQALNGLDAIRLEEGMLSPIYNGKEAMFIFLVAIVQQLFGFGLWQVFFASALVGTLTVPALYLFAREFANKKLAFFSTFFLAVSGWHIALSRSGFRAILVPLLILLFGYFLVKALKAKSKRDKVIYYTLTATTFTLGFYTYNAFLIFGVATIGLGILYALFRYKVLLKDFKANRLAYLMAILSGSVVVLPILLIMVLFPEEYFARAGSVGVFSIGSYTEAAKIVWDNFWQSFWGLFTFGDLNWRHNPSGKALLVPGVSGVFVVGMVLALKHWRKYAPILIGFVVMFFPAILTIEGNMPHSLRMIGVLPFAFLLAGYGANLVWDYIVTKTWESRFFALGALFTMAIIITAGAQIYFDARDSVHYYRDFRCDLTSVQNLVQDDLDRYTIITDEFTIQTLIYLNYPNLVGYLNYNDVLTGDAEMFEDEKYLVVKSFGNYDQRVLDFMRESWKESQFTNRFGEIDYYLYQKE